MLPEWKVSALFKPPCNAQKQFLFEYRFLKLSKTLDRNYEWPLQTKLILKLPFSNNSNGCKFKNCDWECINASILRLTWIWVLNYTYEDWFMKYCREEILPEWIVVALFKPTFNARKQFLFEYRFLKLSKTLDPNYEWLLQTKLILNLLLVTIQMAANLKIVI